MLTAAGKVLFLNGGNTEPVKVVKHTAAPNATASNNRIGALQACSFETAADGTDFRQLSSDVETVVPAATATATHFSVYNSDDVAIHIIAMTTPRSGLVEGDTVTLKAADTRLTIN
ncbi:hypothetical protein [Arsukibacterium sp.]|uniref:hypothetical protein n=1 Tax=Arsukibacterium sp. TaxID=1977258 RepID=UPI00299DD962|nr:hypothetical protein [Arsukibacterium sp.]MDX1538811.1 hypothetical protein [Arsukibacterium sp.]